MSGVHMFEYICLICHILQKDVRITPNQTSFLYYLEAAKFSFLVHFLDLNLPLDHFLDRSRPFHFICHGWNHLPVPWTIYLIENTLVLLLKVQLESKSQLFENRTIVWFLNGLFRVPNSDHT